MKTGCICATLVLTDCSVSLVVMQGIFQNQFFYNLSIVQVLHITPPKALSMFLKHGLKTHAG